jgi:hypothetical protein
MAGRSICIAALILSLLVMCTACSGTDNPSSVNLGQTATLAIGQQVSINGESLAIIFHSVLTDSRCPTGVECFWAGEVSVYIDVNYRDKTERLTITESGASSNPATQEFDQYRITYHVSPYPQAGKKIPSKDYRLQITITRVTSVFISGLRSVLPSSWQINVTDQAGEIGHPHGLEEPVFRIDFLDPLHHFNDESGRQYSPSARLYFYDIAQESTVMAAIEREKVFSWDIPDYYDRTRQYIVVTSPLYINSGHYSVEAENLFKPLDAALKSFFSQQR